MTDRELTPEQRETGRDMVAALRALARGDGDTMNTVLKPYAHQPEKVELAFQTVFGIAITFALVYRRPEDRTLLDLLEECALSLAEG